ncbi:MAG: SMC family ATPase [Gemmatimonadetes bacterium]|nr:SMC family ATPase [Gemmatimonadota bacterium]
MQITRLHLRNFRQHEDTVIDFGAGLTGIIGPNGAGKTTLLEAIGFALYGTSAARGTRDSIRRRGAPPRSPINVELEFTLGPHQYRLVRGLSQAELYLDGDASPIANSLGAVTDTVSRLLGMTRDEFYNTYFTGQKELAVMAAMSAPERARFLSRVLGYERLRLVQDQLKVKRSALKATVEALQRSLVDETVLDAEHEAAEHRSALAGESATKGQQAHEVAAADLARVEPEWQAIKQVRDKVVKLDGDRRVADHKVSDTRERFTALDRQLAEALGAKGQLEGLDKELAPLPGLQEERVALDRQAEIHLARRGYLAQATEMRRTLDSVGDRLAQVPDDGAVSQAMTLAQTGREARHAAETAAEELRTAWVRDAQDAQTKRATLAEQYLDLKGQRDRVSAAGADGDCPTCGRPLGDDLDGVIELLDQQLQEVEFNGSFYKKRIQQLQDEPNELRQAEAERGRRERAAREAEVEARRLQELVQKRPSLLKERKATEERLGDLEKHLVESDTVYDQDRHEEVKRQVQALEPVVLRAERQRALADQAQSLVGEAERVERELSQLEREAASLREQLAELGFTDEAYVQAEQAVERARAGKHEAEKRVVRARAELAAATDALAGVTRRREERTQMLAGIDTAKRDLLLHQELDRAFTDLRTDLNASLRPELSELASVFLRDLTNDRYSDLELDEDYVAVLMEDGQAKPVVSGGEEDVANLALRLAISQMIAERAGQPLSLLVLDEIFGSLDDERRSSVLELLRSLRDRFPQVVLITHIESVREGFDRVIRVEVDEKLGVSRVIEEAVPQDPGAAA